MGYTIKSTEAITDLEEIAKQQHLPFDWRQIIERGHNIYDYKDKETPVSHVIELPPINSSAFFLLIGEINLSELQDPNYKFTNLVEYLNAVELYHYVCLKSNRFRMMNYYFIAIVDMVNGRYAHIISKAFRKYIYE